MKEIDKYINKVQYIVYAIYLVFSLLSLVSINYSDHVSFILRIIRYLCYLFFAIVIILNYKKISKLDILLFVISLLVVIFSKNKHLITIILIIISMKYFDLKKVIKISLVTFSAFLTLCVIFSLIGIIPDWTFTRGSIIRHSLGFIYPTDCFSIYLVIIFLYFAVFQKSYKILSIILLELLNILLYFYTNGRMSFYLINIFLIIMVLLKNKKIYNFSTNLLKANFVKTFSYLLPFLLSVFFAFLVFSYNQGMKYAYVIDDILSERIRLTSSAFDKHHITLFGEQIKWNGWGGYGYRDTNKMEAFEYNFVDSSYPRILLDYGLVFTFIVLIGYSLILNYYIRDNNLIMYLIFIFILLWSVIEPSIINIPKNILVVLFSILLKRDYFLKIKKI